MVSWFQSRHDRAEGMIEDKGAQPMAARKQSAKGEAKDKTTLFWVLAPVSHLQLDPARSHLLTAHLAPELTNE